MVMDAVIGRFSAGGERAHTESHPPIINSGKFKLGNGELPIGQVLMRDAELLLVPYTGAIDEVMVGVLDNSIDTTTEDVGSYLAHGTVKTRLLTKGNGVALDPAELLELHTIGIYPE